MSHFSRVQLSAFVGNAIPANPRTTIEIMNLLNDEQGDFLPNVISGQSLDFNTGKIEATSNLSFSSMRTGVKLDLLNERIDISVSSNPDAEGEYQQLLDNCAKTIAHVIGHYGLKINRLAIVLDLFSTGTAEICDTSRLLKREAMIDFYAKENVIEWSQRCNARIEKCIGQSIEPINALSTVSLATNEALAKRRLMCTLDINTVPEREDYRFSHDSIFSFLQIAIPVAEELESSFQRFCFDGGGNACQ